MNIPWEMIFELIRELLADCPQQDRTAVRGMLRSPMSKHKRWFETRLKRRATAPFTGVMTRRQWNENESEILSGAYAYAQSAEDWELDKIIDD